MHRNVVLLMSLTLYSLVLWLHGCSPSQSPKIIVPNWEYQFPEPLLLVRR